VTLPWTLAETLPCRSVEADRCPLSRGHRHGSLIYALSGALRDANLRSEREKCGLFPDTQGKPNQEWPADLYVSSPDACEGAGTDWVAAAFDVTVVSLFELTVYQQTQRVVNPGVP
jgi:hypothetical protein